MEVKMNESHGKEGTAPQTSSLARSEVSDAMEAAMNSPATGVASGAPDAVNGPAVLGQPLTNDLSNRVSRDISTVMKEPESSRLTATVVKDAFADAQDAVMSRYRTVSASTDDFVHESPWKAIAFAVLGGIIVGMLAAR
jgi:ElaB/YqjD/DUF883 family membrane-anchored ribosome-binding protein